MKEGWHYWKKTSKEERIILFFLIQVKRRLVLTRIQMNYTLILKNKTWNIHRKFRGYLFILGKNKKWKNNFRECSAKLYGNFTQHPGPLF